MGARATFHARAIAEGWKWLTSLHAGWLATAGLVGVAGFAVPTAIKGSAWWIGALVLGGMALAMYAEGVYRAWAPSDEVQVGSDSAQLTAAPGSTVINAQPGSVVNLNQPAPEAPSDES